jgi:hypothetical protein
MKIGSAIPAFIRNTDLIHYLNFLGAIVAPRDEVKSRLDSPTRSLGTRRRLGPFFPVTMHISGLLIFSRHFPPCKFSGFR